jgi:hypothetical protein
MPHRTEARSAKAARTHAAGGYCYCAFSTPLISFTVLPQLPTAKRAAEAARPSEHPTTRTYFATTAFCCAIIDAMVSRIDSMLRPVSVAVSTYG